MDQRANHTLNNVRKSDKLRGERIFSASDFMSQDDRLRIEQARQKTHENKRKFDDVDAYTAEIVARFGYEAYKDWNAGIIPDAKTAKWILAERARDKSKLLSMEGIIIAMIAPTIRRQKDKPPPQSPKLAMKIFREDSKVARGE